MERKPIIIIGAILVAVALLISMWIGDEDTPNSALTSQDIAAGDYKEDRITGEMVANGKELLDEMVIAKEDVEFSTLYDFIHSTVLAFDPESEIQKSDDPKAAEKKLAEATVQYINYFKTEIEARGMEDQFDELQVSAYHVASNDDTKKHEELTESFLNTLQMVADEL